MKKSFILLGIALLSLSVMAQDETQSPATSTPAQLFHKAPKKAAANTEIGFQANIDFEGTFSRMPGVIYSNGSWYDPFSIGGISMGGSVGLRYRRFLFAGVGFNFFGDWGTQYYYEPAASSFYRKGSDKYDIWVLPIFGEFRFLLPTESTCFPYLAFDIGGYVGVSGKRTIDRAMWGLETQVQDVRPDGGFYFSPSLGVEFRYVTIGIGYKLFTNSSFYDHYGFVKVGVSLGRPALLK